MWRRNTAGLRDNPTARVEIAGHTCDLGSDEYNLKLSQARAAAVADWLVAHGIDRARLEVRGYGNRQPKAPREHATRVRRCPRSSQVADQTPQLLLSHAHTQHPSQLYAATSPA